MLYIYTINVDKLCIRIYIICIRICIICIHTCMSNNNVHISVVWRRDVHICNVPS